MTSRLPHGIVFLTASLAVLAAGGCNLDVLTQQLESAAERAHLVGGSGNTLVLANADFAPGAFDNLFTNPSETPPDATYRLYSIDLDTGAARIIDEAASQETLYGKPEDAFFTGYGYPAGRLGSLDGLAEGPWIAKLNYEEGYVSVTDTASGVEARYLDGVADGAEVRLLGLTEDRLLIGIIRPNGGEVLLVAINLLNGDELVIDRVSWFYDPSAIAFDGQRVAFAGIPDFNPATDPLAASIAPTTIDLVDLTTGQRQTLVGEVGGWGLHGVFFDGASVVWLESTEESYFLRAVDTVTKTIETRDQFASFTGDSYRNVYGVNADAVLLGKSALQGSLDSLTIFNFASFEETETITLRTFGGQETVLLKYSTTGLNPGFSTITLLTDDYAVVHDPTTDELIVYTISTAETRRMPLLE